MSGVLESSAEWCLSRQAAVSSVSHRVQLFTPALPLRWRPASSAWRTRPGPPRGSSPAAATCMSCKGSISRMCRCTSCSGFPAAMAACMRGLTDSPRSSTRFLTRGADAQDYVRSITTSGWRVAANMRRLRTPGTRQSCLTFEMLLHTHSFAACATAAICCIHCSVASSLAIHN